MTLTPVDYARCQAESHSRCSNAAEFIAREIEGERGAMSLCGECKGIFERKMLQAGRTSAVITPVPMPG